jgi:hypothetical protein
MIEDFVKVLQKSEKTILSILCTWNLFVVQVIMNVKLMHGKIIEFYATAKTQIYWEISLVLNTYQEFEL